MVLCSTYGTKLGGPENYLLSEWMKYGESLPFVIHAPGAEDRRRNDCPLIESTPQLAEGADQ